MDLQGQKPVTTAFSHPEIARKDAVPPDVRRMTVGILAFLALVHVFLWKGNVPNLVELDFRTFYTAGYMVRTGNASNLFDAQSQFRFQNNLVSKARLALPYIHPPYEAYLDAPFTFLSYSHAYVAFLALNLLLLGASFWMLHSRMSNLAAIFPWVPAALFLAFLPIEIALIQGQDSILLLTILAGAWVLLKRNSTFSAGTLLALGLFRFQIVLPIALLFLIWRRWRFFAGFAVSSLFLFLLSLVMVGWSGARIYCATLLSFSHRAARVDDRLFRVPPKVMPNLRGLVSGLHHLHVPDIWLLALTIAASVAILYLAATKPGSDPLVVAIPAAALISYHFLTHDMSVLLLPLVLVMDQFVGLEGTRDSRRWLFRSAALLFVAPGVQMFVYYTEYFVLFALPLLAFFLALTLQSTQNLQTDGSACIKTQSA